MQKIQILFPEPLIKRMRQIAGRQGLPMSEIVRRATEVWLDRIPEEPHQNLTVPTVDAGLCLMPAEEMRAAFYE